jgi:hypothetical protein
MARLFGDEAEDDPVGQRQHGGCSGSHGMRLPYPTRAG